MARKGLAPGTGQTLMNREGLIPWRAWNLYSSPGTPSPLGEPARTGQDLRLLPNSRLKLPSCLPGSPEDHPHRIESLRLPPGSKRGQLPRPLGILTNGVHPCDHLILAQVLAGLVVS